MAEPTGRAFADGRLLSATRNEALSAALAIGTLAPRPMRRREA